MKRFSLLLIVAFGLYFLWQHYNGADPRRNHPITRLSLFVDEHIDEILGPLPFSEEGQIASPSSTHTLLVLREDIKDLQTECLPAESLLYSTAVKLCDVLVSASQERDRHLVRINDTRAKNTTSPLAQDPERNKKERLAFFENGIALSWQERSQEFRDLVRLRYTQLRGLERSRPVENR